MPNIVKLLVDDSSYNAKIRNAANIFSQFIGQIGGAKSQFGALTQAIKSSTVAQETLNAVMNKNPMGAVLSVATTAAGYLVDKLTAVSEEQQKIAEAAERRAEAERHENETVTNSVAKVITEYELLRQKWQTLSDEHAKADWLKENKRKFNELGIAVNDVKTAEDVFVNNTQAVCNALIARAKAEAYGELYKEQLKKKIGNTINPTVDNGRQYIKQNARIQATKEAEIGAGIKPEDVNWKTEQVMQNGAVSTKTTFGSYKQSGLNKLNQYRRNNALAIQREEDAQLKRLADGMAENQREYETSLRGMGIWDGSGGKGGGKGGKTTVKPKVNVKPEYVVEEGTPDFVKGLIQDLQKRVGQEKDADVRISLLGDIEALKEEYKSMTNLPKPEIEEDPFTEALSPLQQLNAELKLLRENLELAPDTSAYQAGLQAIADKEKEIANFKGDSNISKEGKKTAESWQYAASAVSSVGSAMQTIENPAAKVAGLVAQAIATVAQAFAGAMAADQTTKTNIWAFIGAAAASMGAMISTISAIHSATGYSEGGEIKGKTFSGDRIPIMANAGEVILNRAQQATLAAQLQGGGLYNNLNWVVRMKGEDLYLVASNSQQSRGRGRIVTSNRG